MSPQPPGLVSPTSWSPSLMNSDTSEDSTELKRSTLPTTLLDNELEVLNQKYNILT
jgi:hypothetical protein